MKKSREQRRAEAERRQGEASSRTPRQQLALLDARLGVGVGAEYEREKLHNRMRREAA